MKLKVWFTKNANWMIGLLLTLGLAIFAGLRFDYYFDLNDDVLMKDILAGVYTGTPEGHNIQMLWLISAIISLFYKIARSLPWYGLFLTGCHYACLFLILKRSLRFCHTYLGKAAVALTETVLLGSLLLEHFVFAQYTVTCTLLAGTAVFLFFTTPKVEEETAVTSKLVEATSAAPKLVVGEFITKNIPAVLLVTLAFLVRSEMLLLVLPMICVAGVIKWGSEQVIFTKEHAIQYFSVFGLIILGLLVGQGSHMLAYSSKEWRTFTEFFDNRTELYDFQTPPAYEGNEAFYESIGLTESERILFDNYNFGMDEEIDEKMVGEIAVYAGQLKSAEQPFGEKLKEKLTFYVYRLSRGHGVTGSDFPWNYAIIIGYLAVLVLSLLQKKWSICWKLPFLFGVRTLLWFYILMGDRDPERITHSLYLMELCILGAMLLVEGNAISLIQRHKLDKKSVNTPKWTSQQVLLGLCMGAFLLYGLIISPERISAIDQQQNQRAQVNAPYLELYDYFSTGEQANNFYLIDVYSSVSYSEKMFENVDNSLDNYDIMGGWACKSPLQRKKLAAFGINNMEQALREMDSVYFVRESDEDMDWLPNYYAGHDTPVETQLVDTVAGIFEIYQVKVVD